MYEETEIINKPSVSKSFYTLSPFGTLWIRPDLDAGFTLFVGSQIANHFKTAVEAADAVFFHTTGFVEYDRFNGCYAPTSLDEWGELFELDSGYSPA